MDFFVRMYMRVCTHKAGKNASIRDKKTHVYRVAGMIASIRGKKTARISCHNFETNGRPYYKSTLATLFAAIWKIILGGILF